MIEPIWRFDIQSAARSVRLHVVEVFRGHCVPDTFPSIIVAPIVFDSLVSLGRLLLDWLLRRGRASFQWLQDSHGICKSAYIVGPANSQVQLGCWIRSTVVFDDSANLEICRKRRHHETVIFCLPHAFKREPRGILLLLQLRPTCGAADLVDP
jgi:hypothetical protein